MDMQYRKIMYALGLFLSLFLNSLDYLLWMNRAYDYASVNELHVAVMRFFFCLIFLLTLFSLCKDFKIINFKKLTSNEITFSFILSYANAIVKLLLPGFFTGDAKIFVSMAIGASPTTDLVAPLYLLMFKPIFYLFEGKMGFFFILQVYLSVISIWLFVISIVKNLVGYKTNNIFRSTILGLLVIVPVVLNPVYIGFISLCYVDVYFTAFILLSYSYGFFVLGHQVTNKRIMVFLLLVAISSLLRHNGIFYIFGFSVVLSVMVIKQRRVSLTLRKNTSIYSVSVVLLIALVYVLSAIVNAVSVDVKSNYYIWVPVYEMVGVASDNPEIRAELKTLGKYMDLDWIAKRYSKEDNTALIQTFWTVNNKEKLDKIKITNNHDIIFKEYLELIQKYPGAFLKIKMKHGLRAIGLAKLNPYPFFSIYKDYTIKKEKMSFDRNTLGIYPKFQSSHFVNTLRKQASYLTKNHRTLTVSPLVWLVGLSILVITSITASRKRKELIMGLSVLIGSTAYISGYFIVSHGAFLKYPYPAYLCLTLTFLVIFFNKMIYFPPRLRIPAKLNTDSGRT